MLFTHQIFDFRKLIEMFVEKVKLTFDAAEKVVEKVCVDVVGLVSKKVLQILRTQFPNWFPSRVFRPGFPFPDFPVSRPYFPAGIPDRDRDNFPVSRWFIILRGCSVRMSPPYDISPGVKFDNFSSNIVKY